MSASDLTGSPDQKLALRQTVRAARVARPARDRTAAAAAFCDAVLSLAEMSQASTVAAYLPTAEEPDTRPLLSALVGNSVEVLLPVLRPDLDLDWACYRPGALQPGRWGLLEPGGPPLGVNAVAGCQVVICPGLAGDRRGHRLGRGGGSYDRALARLAPSTLRCLLLYDDEVVDEVPTGPHDQPIDVLLTPTRTLRATPPS